MLASFFNPGAIAVIGASSDPKKVGHAVLNNLIRFKYKGSLYPVNPSGQEILGLKTYQRVSDYPGECGPCDHRYSCPVRSGLPPGLLSRGP